MVAPSVNEPGAARASLLAQRRMSYCLVLAGIVIVNAAYLRLLSQDSQAALGLPLAVALLGLLVATLGFKKFYDYQRRQRSVFSLTELPAPEVSAVVEEQPGWQWKTFSRN